MDQNKQNKPKDDLKEEGIEKIGIIKEIIFYLRGVLISLKNQSILESVEKNYHFFTYLTFIGLVYVFNSLYAERQATKVDILEKQIKELKSEYMTLNARINTSRKQSEVTSVADTIGLKQLKEPPFKLVVKYKN